MSERYFHLPLTAGKYTYAFAYRIVSKLGICHTDGSYLRKFSEEGLERVLSYCRSEKPVMYSEALSEAYDDAWAAPSDLWRRPVWISNPEHRALSDVLVYGSSLAFDAIVVEGTSILIPYYYSITKGIISGWIRARLRLVSLGSPSHICCQWITTRRARGLLGKWP